MPTTEATDFISVQEFVEALEGRISRNSVYSAIADGTIPSVRIGRRRILLPRDALRQALESQVGLRRHELTE
jgi:excisionase family DNA binding protein